MTFQRFMVGTADFMVNRRWMRGLRPDPARSWGPGVWVAVILHGPLVGVLLGLVVMGTLLGSPMRGSWWPVRWGAEIGLLVGFFDALLLGFAWSRRAAGMRNLGLTERPPVAPRRWWQTWLVGPLIGLLALVVTPQAMWFSIDNARGTGAWRAAHAALVARGEPMTPEQVAGPPPAEADNMAATPLLRPLLDYRLVVTNGASEFVWGDPEAAFRLEAIGLPSPVQRAGESKRSSKGPVTNDARLNLESYARGIRAVPVRRVQHGVNAEYARRYGVVTSAVPVLDDDKAAAIVITNAAADVIGYLKRFEPEMAELERAAALPRCRFPVHWDEAGAAALTHLAAGKRLSTLFRVRAAARLASGDAEGALADTRTLLRLARMFSEEPLLISRLVEIAQSAIAVQGVWEGLAARRWTDPQIAGLQEAVAGVDLRAGLISALRGERCLGNTMYDSMLGGAVRGTLHDATPGARPAEIGAGGGGVPNLLVTPRLLTPQGFLRRNQVQHNRMLDALIAELQDPTWPVPVTNRLSTVQRQKALGFVPLTPDAMLPSMLLPALDPALAKASRQAVTLRLAETACALERFRLKNGRFPEGLEELVPAFLKGPAIDPMTGGPLRYLRTGDGWFRLWSVGLNGRDDGGTMKPPAENDRSGDWVWPVPVPGSEPTLFGAR